MADNLPDISLDNPAARERFDAAVKAARAGEPAAAAAMPRLQSLWQLLLLLLHAPCSCSARPLSTALTCIGGWLEEGCTVALSQLLPFVPAVAYHPIGCTPLCRRLGGGGLHRCPYHAQ